MSVNPFLTTDDPFWHRLTSTACYQLVQSVLNTGSALAERVEVGGYTTLADSAWLLMQLAIEKPWLTLGGLLHKNTPFTLYRVHFQHFWLPLVWKSPLWSEGPNTR